MEWNVFNWAPPVSLLAGECPGPLDKEQAKQQLFSSGPAEPESAAEPVAELVEGANSGAPVQVEKAAAKIGKAAAKVDTAKKAFAQVLAQEPVAVACFCWALLS